MGHERESQSSTYGNGTGMSRMSRSTNLSLGFNFFKFSAKIATMATTITTEGWTKVRKVDCTNAEGGD